MHPNSARHIEFSPIMTANLSSMFLSFPKGGRSRSSGRSNIRSRSTSRGRLPQELLAAAAAADEGIFNMSASGMKGGRGPEDGNECDDEAGNSGDDDVGSVT